MSVGPDADRWLEMDLTWFDPAADFGPQLDELFERVAPLARRRRRPPRHLLQPRLARSTSSPSGPATPTSRSPPAAGARRAWAAVGYDRLAEFVVDYRAAAARHGVGDAGCGILFVDWAHVVWPPELKIYDFDSDWYDRHPELYEPPRSFIGMPDLHPVNLLARRRLPVRHRRRAASPRAPRSASSSAPSGRASRRSPGFDAILLRDGFCGPMIYTRNGPYGTTARPIPASSARVQRRRARTCSATSSRPRPTGSSSATRAPSARSPTGGSGASTSRRWSPTGYIDAWIEQTWAGAWQDWWHQLWKGWTFQTANLLTRGAMIAQANEQRERRLRAVPPGRDVGRVGALGHDPPGAGQAHVGRVGVRPCQRADARRAAAERRGLRLVAEQRATWSCCRPTTSRSSAACSTGPRRARPRSRHVHGPALVYDRTTMAALMRDTPGRQRRRVDRRSGGARDEVGRAGVGDHPSGVAGRRRRPPTGMLIAQTPSDRVGRRALLGADALAVFGRADAVAPAIARRARHHAERRAACAADFWVSTGDHPDTPPFDRPYVPEHCVVEVGGDADVRYRHPRHAARHRARTAPVVAADRLVGAVQPVRAQVPGRLDVSLRSSSRRCSTSWRATSEQSTPRPRPGRCRSRSTPWRSGGVDHLLVGNLETGEFGDARLDRQLEVRLPVAALALGDRAARLELVDGAGADLGAVAAVG